jgi:hypothetical protein
MRKKALMEKLMKSQAWFSSFRCSPWISLKDFQG